MKVFEERLLQCRNNIHKTQHDVAKEAGLNFRTYCRYERGEAEPTLPPLVKLANYFHVSLDYLAGLTDDPAPPSQQ